MNKKFTLAANGVDITDALEGRLISLSLTDERTGDTDQLTVEIDNSDDEIALPPPDAKLAISLADSNGLMVDMGEFAVDTSELNIETNQITIVARSADIAASLNVRREVSYHETTLSDIITQIASRNGLETVISAVFNTKTIEHFDQTSESDLSVLNRLGDLYDAMAVVKAGRVIFMPLGESKTLSGQPLPAVDVERSDCSNPQLRLEKSQYTGVMAFWNETHGAIRNQVSIGTDTYPLKIRGTFRSEQLAQDAINAKWSALQRAQTQLTLSLQSPNPYAQPECPLNFMGEWPSAVSSQALIIARVTHHIDSSNAASVDIEAEQSL